MSHAIKKPQSFRSLAGQVTPSKTTLALGVAGAVLAPAAIAQEAGTISLDTLKVEDRTADTNPYAEPGAPYKAKKSADERYKRDIAELPKNISVLTEAQILDSGYTDLREILDAQPGITLGTGENGNAFGDRYIIRGQEARSDVFVDGLRDPGMTIRESFATEQVEISKGPDSSFGGRGTTGGAVNSITKQATTDYDFTKLSTGFGTDKHTRITLDHNQVIDDTTAIRANVLYGYEEVPDRAPADRERTGLALSLKKQVNDDLDFTVDYYKMQANDTPDMGGFLVGSGSARKPVDNPPVYVQEGDFLDSDVDTLTAKINFNISPDMRLTNATRLGQTENGYVATGARQSTAYQSETDALGTTTDNPSYTTTSLSTHQGWQEVDYFVNATQLYWDKIIGGKKHEFGFGLEYSDHKVLNGVYAGTALAKNGCYVSGRGGVSEGTCIINPQGQTIPNVNNTSNRTISKDRWDQDWQVKTVSASIMDTVDLNDQWTVHGGLRADYYDFDLVTQNASLAKTGYSDTDMIWNYHMGAVYKFRPDAMLYANLAKASDINGGESDVGTSSAYGGAAITPEGDFAGKPETTHSLELGTKWNVFDNKMLATAAVFLIQKSDVYEAPITNAQDNDPNRYANLGTLNTGKNETKGIEFGLSGNVTDKLSASAGLAIMQSEVTQSNTPSKVGKTLSNFAESSASVQLKYQATGKLSVGGALKYESERYAGQPDTAASFSATTGEYSQPIPAYTVMDLFANYRFNKNMDARVNVGNVMDKDYYLAGYQSGAFLYKGDARNVRVTLNYDF